jgi:hypothetical protein
MCILNGVTMIKLWENFQSQKKIRDRGSWLNVSPKFISMSINGGNRRKVRGLLTCGAWPYTISATFLFFQ